MLAALILTAVVGQCAGGSCAAPAAYPQHVYPFAPSVPAASVYQPVYQSHYSWPTRRVYRAPRRARVLRSTPWGAGACYGGVCR